MSVQTLDLMAQESEEETIANEKFLSGIIIEHVPSAYAYLVDTDGTMLYHPVTEKVGKPVENRKNFRSCRAA